jgi:hypothetical protein
VQPSRLIAPALSLALAACSGPHAEGNAAADGPTPQQPAAAAAAAATAATAAPQPSAAPATAPPANAPAPSVDGFVPAGMQRVDAVRGDLTGAGRADALLVVSPPTGDAKLGEGAPRTVILLTQDAAGALHKSAENTRLVPCARCGGMAGDPYAYARIESGRFTVSISGGSRERWADDIAFRYDAARKTWLLDKVVRELTDTQTGQSKTLALSSKELGEVTFAAFDPATLPKPPPL